MSNRKNYNSIVFLTTLSVYLGLVLVGTPPILAQAALTQKIEIKNEAEIKDDLDKKPDDEKALSIYAAALEDLFSLAKDFSAKYSERLRDNKYEFDCALTHAFKGRYNTSCSGGSGLHWGGFDSPMEKISNAFPHIYEKGKDQVRVNLILSDNAFFLKTTLAQDLGDQAERYQNYYDGALSRIKLQQFNNSRTIIYQNTSIFFENNQVFIVTRLPRASIDELLAKKVAQ